MTLREQVKVSSIVSIYETTRLRQATKTYLYNLTDSNLKSLVFRSSSGLNESHAILNTTGSGFSLIQHTMESSILPTLQGYAQIVSFWLSPDLSNIVGGSKMNVSLLLSLKKQKLISASSGDVFVTFNCSMYAGCLPSLYLK